jgi:chemotaxis methyl-accepting protein methylase
MIYFDRRLQERVHQLFHESLPIYGYLALGNKESLRLSKYEHYFRGGGRDGAHLPPCSLNHLGVK